LPQDHTPPFQDVEPHLQDPTQGNLGPDPGDGIGTEGRWDEAEGYLPSQGHAHSIGKTGSGWGRELGCSMDHWRSSWPPPVWWKPAAVPELKPMAGRMSASTVKSNCEPTPTMTPQQLLHSYYNHTLKINTTFTTTHSQIPFPWATEIRLRHSGFSPWERQPGTRASPSQTAHTSQTVPKPGLGIWGGREGMIVYRHVM